MAEYHGTVTVHHIGLGPLGIPTPGHLLHGLIPGRENTVLSRPTFGQPPAVFNTTFNGSIQPGPVCSGLAA